MSKFCLIHSHLNGRGGSQRYCLEMALALQERGHEVSILCLVHDRELCYPEISSKLDIHAFISLETNLITPNQICTDSQLHTQSLLFADKILPRNSSGNMVKSWISMIIKFTSHIVLRRKVIDNAHVILHEEPVTTWSAKLSRCFYKTKSMNWLCYDTPLKWLETWNDSSNETFLSIFLSTTFLKLDQLIVSSLKTQPWVLDYRQKQLFLRQYKSYPKVLGGAVANDMYADPHVYSRTGIIGCATNFQFRKNVQFFIDLALVLHKLGKLNRYKFKLNIAKCDTHCENQFFTQLYRHPEIHSVFDVSTNPFSGDDEYKAYLDSCQWFVYPNSLQTWGHAPLEAMCRNTYTLISDGCGITDFMSFDSATSCIFNSLDVHSVANAIVRSASSHTIYKSIVDSQYSWSRQFSWDKQINTMLGTLV
jgi:glycosyltransferase involved in cell wall biosynthesis